MAAMRILYISFSLVTLALCAPQVKDEIEIQDCGSQAELLSLTFDGCSQYPCIVHQGETARGQLTMRAKTATTSLTCKIVGIILGMELPFNGCPVNACDHLSTGDCEVEEEEMLVYDMEIEVLDAYPKLEVVAKWMLKGDNGDNFMCITVPLEVTEGPEYYSHYDYGSSP